MKPVILWISLLLMCVSCTTENEKNISQNDISYFVSSLKSDMTYNSIESTFGKPADDIGSGIHIYVYKLSDSTEVWIGYSDKILFARQMDSEGNLIKSIIENGTYLLTCEFFRDVLKVNMNYESIVSIFGEPEKTIGSGIHIYVYKLSDSTEMWIGFTDKIFYARHMDSEGNLIDSIIENGVYQLTYEYFKKNIKADMNYEAIVLKFGEPVSDIGSGIHVYVYELVDSTWIMIGYDVKIVYIKHVDSNYQIIDVIY